MATMLPLALAQIGAPRGDLAVAADVAVIVLAVAVFVVVAMMGLLFLRINKVLGDARHSVQQNLGPVSDRARAISDNVEFITEVLRSDVESLNTSVKALTDRLTLASERMEERIEEFNALMEVVQGEAEDIFLDTAATVRGVRESARSITAPRPASPSGPAVQAEVEEDEGVDEADLSLADPSDASSHAED